MKKKDGMKWDGTKNNKKKDTVSQKYFRPKMQLLERKISSPEPKLDKIIEKIIIRNQTSKISR